ncbi:MAG: replication-associated recombination protein A [Phycisphaerales bacterium]
MSGSGGHLFARQQAEALARIQPLAARVRPRSLEEFRGQTHLIGPGKLLRRMIEADRMTSIIFTGPPGTGKTTLAEVIAARTSAWFERAHAASIGVREVRSMIEDATSRAANARADGVETGRARTILFLDEIHRFARNQQDVLLDAVERGIMTLIGATTENPFFSINSALVSRSTVFRFEPLSIDDIRAAVLSATQDERGFPGIAITIDDDALELWARKSDGDARRALSALEVAVLSELAADDREGHDESRPRVHVDLAVAQDSIQQKALVYEGSGDAHYDVISAFIKSMRGSDPDAAVYWLARMLEAGEDPRFIARRIAILASEDIGNADPNAVRIAAAAWEITERVGMPECQLTLAQAAIYMAVAPKSNACALAIWEAMEIVRSGRTIEVPRHLRDPNSTASNFSDGSSSDDSVKQSMGDSRTYRCPHDFGGFVDQEYLGVDHVFYRPTENGIESKIKARLQHLREGMLRGQHKSSGRDRPDSDSGNESNDNTT